jgi:hypothetical protein
MIELVCCEENVPEDLTWARPARRASSTHAGFKRANVPRFAVADFDESETIVTISVKRRRGSNDPTTGDERSLDAPPSLARRTVRRVVGAAKWVLGPVVSFFLAWYRQRHS